MTSEFRTYVVEWVAGSPLGVVYSREFSGSGGIIPSFALPLGKMQCRDSEGILYPPHYETGAIMAQWLREFFLPPLGTTYEIPNIIGTMNDLYVEEEPDLLRKVPLSTADGIKLDINRFLTRSVTEAILTILSPEEYALLRLNAQVSWTRKRGETDGENLTILIQRSTGDYLQALREPFRLRLYKGVQSEDPRRKPELVEEKITNYSQFPMTFHLPYSDFSKGRVEVVSG